MRVEQLTRHGGRSDPMRIGLMVAVALVLAMPGPSLEAQGGWRPLFNGKTLDGWYACNGTAPFTVEDGAIVGRTVVNSPNSFLCTKETFGDFILEYEVWVDDQPQQRRPDPQHQRPRDQERPRARPAGRNRSLRPRVERRHLRRGPSRLAAHAARSGRRAEGVPHEPVEPVPRRGDRHVHSHVGERRRRARTSSTTSRRAA